MTTLIIPCAGKSSRFPNTKPKWLFTHPDGKLMIEKSVQNIRDLSFIKKKIIVITKEIDKKFNAKFILNKAFNKSFEILILNKQTSSASETIFEAIKKKKLKGQIIIKDSDCYIDIKNYKKYLNSNFLGGVNLNKNLEVQSLKMKSFIKLNFQNQIIDIIEKRIVSEHICVGLYSFSNEKLFLKAYSNCKKFIKNTELYLSFLVKYLINENYLFKYVECENYEDYGTFKDWLIIRRKYRSFFVDIDGVVFKNKGKFGVNNWYSKNILLKKNVKKLLTLNNSGAEIIFCSARSEDQKSRLNQELKNIGFKNFRIILGINHSQRVIINDFTDQNPNPTAVAINILRDNDDLDIYV